MNIVEINVLVLAYLGDGIYENFVREKLVKEKASVDAMQKESIKYVSAMKQAEFLDDLISENFLSEEEINVVKRARNYKSNSHPKNCDIISYKKATGLEALIGFLHLSGNDKRVCEIMEKILR